MGARWLRWSGAAVAVATTVLVLPGSGNAAPPPRAVKTETRFVGTAAWRTLDSQVDHGGVGIGQLFCASSPSLDGMASFSLPLDVPDGAALTKVTVFHFDDDATAGHDLRFAVGVATPGVSDLLDGFHEVVSDHTAPPAIVGSTQQQAAVLVPSPGPVTVDRTTGDYFVAATFGACGTYSGSEAEGTLFPTLTLDGVQFEYTVR